MTKTKLEKYGYAIDKLKIVKCKKEFEFSIDFRISDSEDHYTAFQNASDRYSKCFQVYKQEDLDRYLSDEFSLTEEEKEEYAKWLEKEPADSVFRFINGDGDLIDISRVALNNRDLGKIHHLKQANNDRTLWYDNGSFHYHEFLENNAMVVEALKNLRKLRRYTYKPTKRTCVSDLFWILKTLDIWWS